MCACAYIQHAHPTFPGPHLSISRILCIYIHMRKACIHRYTCTQIWNIARPQQAYHDQGNYAFGHLRQKGMLTLQHLGYWMSAQQQCIDLHDADRRVICGPWHLQLLVQWVWTCDWLSSWSEKHHGARLANRDARIFDFPRIFISDLNHLAHARKIGG